MPLALNTSHPLYSNLVGLIAVDDDNVIKDLKNTGTTCTPDAAVTLSSGTYGRHFQTTIVSNNSKGVALSAVIPFGTTAAPNGTVVAVLNSVQSVTANARNSLLTNSAAASSMPTICLNSAKQVAVSSATNTPGTFTTGNIATGANMVTVTRTGQTAHQVVLNANDETYNGGPVGYNNVNNGINYVGGFATGGYGAVSADFVWIAVFNKVLNSTEIADLHASLGANNTFGLIAAGAADATAPGATLTGTSSISAGSATGGSGGTDATAPGATLTGTSSISAGSASGNGGAGTFTSDAMENNTGAGLLASTSVTWTWWQGSIGATPTSLTHGSGTTSAGGVLSLTGLPTGAGFLIARTADSAGVYYQPGTVA